MNTKPKGAVQTTTTEVKARLKAVRETERQYRLAKDKYAAYMQLLTCGRSVRYDSRESVAKTEKNLIEDAYCQLADYETEMNRLLVELVTVRKEAEKRISCLDDPTEREVLTRRYLMYQQWGDIAQEMNYNRRHIYKLHGWALQKMALNGT